MVTQRKARGRGVALIELICAVGILTVVMAGVAAAWYTDHQALKANYYRAVAMEIVDGEMEALLAGEWQAHAEGTHDYAPLADAARNLPDGSFRLTVRGRTLRLEWLPARRGKGGRVVREARVK